MEKVKIIDLNHFKKYDELLKQQIASQFVYATEDDVLGLFEAVTPETAPVDAIEEQFLENLRKNFKNGLKIFFNPFFNTNFKYF